MKYKRSRIGKASRLCAQSILFALSRRFRYIGMIKPYSP